MFGTIILIYSTKIFTLNRKIYTFIHQTYTYEVIKRKPIVKRTIIELIAYIAIASN